MVRASDSLYGPVVEGIAQRILAAEEAISLVSANSQDSVAYLGCEVAVLQIRMICELLLVGSTAAHLNEGGVSLDAGKWRPKDSFYELSKVNAHPLQIPVKVSFDQNGSGQHRIEPTSQPIEFSAVSEIYGKCGDLLHIPSVKQIVDRRLPEFDIALINRWIGGLKEIAMGHVLMLPERKVVLLAIWGGTKEAKPEAFRLDSEGPSTLILDALPAFCLFP